MSSKQKKNCFKLELKHQIVQRIEDNISLDLILEEFRSYRVTMDSIYSFNKRKDEIKHDFESCLSSQAKSSKPLRYPEIDRLLVEFVTKAPTEGLPINDINTMRKLLIGLFLF